MGETKDISTAIKQFFVSFCLIQDFHNQTEQMSNIHTVHMMWNNTNRCINRLRSTTITTKEQ